MHGNGAKNSTTDKTVSRANEDSRRQLCETGKTGFPQEERTSLMKVGEKGPVERLETSTLTAPRLGSSSEGETHV